MAINKNNRSIRITVSKPQFDWLHAQAKKNNLQISKFICWLIDKNVSRFFISMSNKDKEITRKLVDTVSQEEWDALFPEEPETNNNDEMELPF